MNRKSSVLAVAACVCAAYAVAQPASSPGASGSTAAAKMAGADKDFFTKAAQGGMAEVQSSQLAASKASSAEVKAFAQQMVTDHTKAGEELGALASSKGVTIPSAPSAAQKSEIKALEAASGADFDRKYAKGMGVDAHRTTVALFKKTSASAKDADVKAFAAKTLPTLEHHLKMAEDMNRAVSKK